MRFFKLLPLLLILTILTACAPAAPTGGMAATTAPVAQFAAAIAEGTDVTVTQIITDSVSCLHDYSLSVRQMETLESSRAVLLSGAGLEDFMADALASAGAVYDCSHAVEHLPLAGHHEHDGHGHGHDDPHIWLAPENAKTMAWNIYTSLSSLYPNYEPIFKENTEKLQARLDELQAYGEEQLSGLTCRRLVTFHDGFGYLAHAFDLEILEAMEEESGSEASASELIHLVHLVEAHQLPAVFTERNGSVSAASILHAETGVEVYTLDMAMGGSDYFEAMTHNIDTLKEALQ